MDKTSMIAGIGCRSGVSAEQVEAAIDAAIRAARTNETGSEPARVGSNSPTPDRILTALATPAVKAQELGIAAAAASRGVPLILISQQALEAANAGTVTRSEHSMASMNVHSVAEAAALAGAAIAARDAAAAPEDATMTTAGTATPAGPKATAAAADEALEPRPARLLISRITVGPVTCALADTGTSP